MATKIDEKSYTPSDFAVIAHNVDFDEMSEVKMKEKIVNHLKRYGIDGIEYFMPIFSIRQHVQDNQQLQKYTAWKNLIE